MNVVKYIGVLFLVVQTGNGWAQEPDMDTIKALNTIEVSTPHVRAQATGNRIQSFDSTLMNRYATNNLAELLNAESDVYIKSYGLGTLATTSIRGGGSNHTIILWNGFNLQNPMYGPQDLSLISNNFFNDVMVQYGSAGATWGSGAVGGAIHLNNTAVYDKGFSVVSGATFGSFSDKQEHANIEWSKKRFISSIKLSNHTAKNNFPFQNTSLPEQPIQRQTNAELRQVGVLNENYFQINDKQKINARFWYQNASRNIPPSLGQIKNVSNQKDESYRITSEWQRSSERLLLTVRAGHFYETLIYDDTLNVIHSINKSRVTIAEAESKFYLTKFDMITLAVNNTYSEAVSEGYEKNPHQDRVALIGSYKIHNKKNTLNGFVNIRKEFIQPDHQEVDTIVFTPFKSKPALTKASQPFTYSIGSDGSLFKCLSFNIAVAQHYRIPTFNDLYWAQGGNIALKPENGWGEEAGITFKKESHRFSVLFNANVFNRNINNWVLWTPTSSGYWAPANIMKVWSRGAEYRLTVKYTIQKITFTLNALWNYTLSTNEKAKAINDGSLGKQLIYTPMYKGNASFGITYKKFNITYNQKYVGYTYTSVDNKHYLKPYLIGGLKLSQVFTISGFKLQTFVSASNLFNSSYEVIDSRPMPGRNYQIGCTFYFNKPNN
ncbi:MAG TPA: TonB-dependent receptor plug domain-containing protein [Bacteroidia bacterium]|jgi:iron complex outermembrane receptor protein|nr:TonB-dependent receptor plug domain-containing protein [Bacteroidia bacterium]